MICYLKTAIIFACLIATTVITTEGEYKALLQHTTTLPKEIRKQIKNGDIQALQPQLNNPYFLEQVALYSEKIKNNYPKTYHEPCCRSTLTCWYCAPDCANVKILSNCTSGLICASTIAVWIALVTNDFMVTGVTAKFFTCLASIPLGAATGSINDGIWVCLHSLHTNFKRAREKKILLNQKKIDQLIIQSTYGQWASKPDSNEPIMSTWRSDLDQPELVASESVDPELDLV